MLSISPALLLYFLSWASSLSERNNNAGRQRSVYRVVKTHKAPILIGHFRKRAPELVALLRKETCKIRRPMHLRHPVAGWRRHVDVSAQLVALGDSFRDYSVESSIPRSVASSCSWNAARWSWMCLNVFECVGICVEGWQAWEIDASWSLSVSDIATSNIAVSADCYRVARTHQTPYL